MDCTPTWTTAECHLRCRPLSSIPEPNRTIGLEATDSLLIHCRRHAWPTNGRQRAIILPDPRNPEHLEARPNH